MTVNYDSLTSTEIRDKLPELALEWKNATRKDLSWGHYLRVNHLKVMSWDDPKIDEMSRAYRAWQTAQLIKERLLK